MVVLLSDGEDVSQLKEEKTRALLVDSVASEWEEALVNALSKRLPQWSSPQRRVCSALCFHETRNDSTQFCLWRCFVQRRRAELVEGSLPRVKRPSFI